MSTSSFRITRSTYNREEALSGRGAEEYGGRWNFPGERAVYCSEHLSLAALEKRVNTGLEGAGLSYHFYELSIPSEELITGKDPEDLPDNWRRMPPPSQTKAIGSSWLQGEKTPVFRVPSVIVPREHSLILNPRHPEREKIEVKGPEDFSFDPRLWS